MFLGLDNTQVEYLSRKLFHFWQKLAEWLDFSSADIKEIANSSDKKTDDDCCRQVLEIWRKRKPASCDLLGELAKILNECDEFIGLSDFLVEGRCLLNLKSESVSSPVHHALRKPVFKFQPLYPQATSKTYIDGVLKL